ncbi:hypothetical protein ACN9JF_19215 (plasmid) [Pseudoalteromonas lipolytica]|uniref:hypothetical protein n=1 Tax=Pseudoalteromonas lipolytica TaxID=570156 RepID=UPI003BA34FD0
MRSEVKLAVLVWLIVFGVNSIQPINEAWYYLLGALTVYLVDAKPSKAIADIIKAWKGKN